MSWPDFPEVSVDVLRMISELHGLGVKTFSRLPSIGRFNAIYLLGDDLILRVPRNYPHFVAALTRRRLLCPQRAPSGCAHRD
ncbi:MAG: hypothetical protein WKH64_05810 [Chloroflexia bacterium]